MRMALLLTIALTLPLAAQEPPSEGFPADAPREGTLITVDLSTNHLYLFRDGQLVRKSLAATGSDKVLRKGSKVWWFRTPRGFLQVGGKIKDPVWTKPDWAFVEEGQRIPPADSPLRKQKGKMGRYALDLGGGVLIHGTDDPKSIGKKASHGCIRLPDGMLAFLWKEVEIGTPVYIFESKPNPDALVRSGLNDLEMTLETGGEK